MSAEGADASVQQAPHDDSLPPNVAVEISEIKTELVLMKAQVIMVKHQRFTDTLTWQGVVGPRA